MKRKLLLSLFCLCVSYTNAQYIYYLEKKKDQTEKLLKAIEEEPVDSIKAIKSFEISANFLTKQDLENYRKYLEQGKQLSKNSKVVSDIGLYYESLIHFTKPNALELLENDFFKILPILEKYKENEARRIRVIMIQNLANFSLMKGDEKVSMNYLLNKAIPLARTLKNNEFLPALYKDVAIRFFNAENYPKTLQYAQLSQKLLEGLKTKTGFTYGYLCETYMLKAEIFFKLNQHKKALPFIAKTEKILEQFPENNFTPYYYNILGEYQRKNKNFKEALQSFDKGIVEAEKFKNTIIANRLKIFKQNLYSEIGEYEKSNELLNEVAKKSTVFRDKKDILKAFSRNFVGLKDSVSALLYAKKYVESFDSINTVKKSKDIAILEAKYSQAENGRKLLLLEKQKNDALLTAKSNRLFNIAFGLLSAFLCTIVFFLWKYTKDQKSIAIEKENNYKNKIQIIEKEKEIQIMKTIIDSEETERKRIARDLHDGVGSRLSALKMQLNAVQDKSPENENLAFVSDSLSASITELRQTAFNLVPETLFKLGLELALKDLCQSMQNEKVIIEFSSNEIQTNIIESHQTTIFRIIQELLNNALKHANCSEIIVDCSQNQNLFLITVEDNGIGFNTEEIQDFTGLGLKSIKNRVELLSGRLEVKSNFNEGTVFNIELKVQLKNG